MSLEIYSSSEISHDSPLTSSHANFGSVLFSNISQYSKKLFKRSMNHLFRSLIHKIIRLMKKDLGQIAQVLDDGRSVGKPMTPVNV